MPPQKQMVPKKPGKNVLNKNNKVKILNLLKGTLSLAEVGWHCMKNESSICSITLNSMHLRMHGILLVEVSLQPYRHRYQGFTVHAIGN
jgi:hypothetical protein